MIRSIIICAFLLLGCQNQRRASVGSIYPVDVFSGFTFLDIPVSDIRIGAIYVRGIGANGNGLSSKDLMTQRSFSRSKVESSKSTQAKVNGTLFKLIGLDAELYKSGQLDIEYSDVELISIRDILSLNIKTNTRYIYQALKVKSLAVTTDKTLTSEITANIDKALNGASLIVEPLGIKDKVMIDGVDVFIAYKLISFSDPEFEVRTKEIKNYTQLGWAAVFDNYTVKFIFDKLLDCVEIEYPSSELYPKPGTTFGDTYPGHRITVEDDHTKSVKLLPESCMNEVFYVELEDQSNISGLSNPKSNFELPFFPEAQFRKEFILDKHIQEEEFIIEKIKFRDIVLKNKEYRNTYGFSYGYNNLTGKVDITKIKYKIELSK